MRILFQDTVGLCKRPQSIHYSPNLSATVAYIITMVIPREGFGFCTCVMLPVEYLHVFNLFFQDTGPPAVVDLFSDMPIPGEPACLIYQDLINRGIINMQ
jgi:hypothetical protein